MNGRHISVAGSYRHMKGWRPDRPDPNDFPLSTPTGLILPDSADLRPHCPPVMDQGDIGSCTANASTTAMSFLEHKDKKSTLLSRLFVYAMTRHLEGTPLSEDSGAEIRDVMKALSTYGVPEEREWPYIVSKFSVDPPAQAKTDALKNKAVMYYRCPNLFTLMASLDQGFPVVIGFSVPDNMMGPECAKTGLVLPPLKGESFDGGHCVLAVGFNTKMQIGPEVGAVLCQNSWSAGWALGGYFWLPMSFWTGGVKALVSDCWTIRRRTGP